MDRAAIATPAVVQPGSSRQEEYTLGESECWECSDEDDLPLSVVAANNGGRVVEHAGK
nr:unnamed protein product [Callosobruchus analis]